MALTSILISLSFRFLARIQTAVNSYREGVEFIKTFTEAKCRLNNEISKAQSFILIRTNEFELRGNTSSILVRISESGIQLVRDSANINYSLPITNIETKYDNPDVQNTNNSLIKCMTITISNRKNTYKMIFNKEHDVKTKLLLARSNECN